MSECVHKVGKFCMIGKFNNRPTDEDCKSCDAYEGKDRGLGDKVDRFTKATGIKGLVKKAANKTGKPCGCGKRRAKLNQMFPSKDGS